MNEKILYSTTDAAEYLNLSVAAIKYHIYVGRNIKPSLVGHSLVFTKEQLDQFQDNRRPPGRPRKQGDK